MVMYIEACHAGSMFDGILEDYMNGKSLSFFCKIYSLQTANALIFKIDSSEILRILKDVLF